MTSLAGGGQDAGHPRLRHRRAARGARRGDRAAARAGSTTPSSTTRAAVVDRASGRLRLSADHTVVAHRRCDRVGQVLDVQRADRPRPGGRRRAPAHDLLGDARASGGRTGADELLDWLGHPAAAPGHPRLDARHRRARTTRSRAWCCSTCPTTTRPRSSHHLEVDRLVELADLLVWVLDPQKYADAAIHDRYLAPLADARRRDAGGAQPHRHRAGVAARVDARRRTPAARRRTGSAACRCFAVSARHGDGIAELRAEIAGRVAAKKVDPSAARRRHPRGRRPAGAEVTGRARPTRCRRSGSRRWTTPSPTRPGSRPSSHAVERVHPAARQPRHRLAGDVVAVAAPARPAQAAPPRPRRGGQAAHRRRPGPRCPQPTQVQRARVDTEVRALADEVTAGLAPAVGARRPPGVDLAARRPRRPARRGPRRHRPRGGADPGLGRRGAAAAVAADPDRRSVGGAWLGDAGGDGLPAAARSRTPRSGGASRGPPLMLLGGVAGRRPARPWSAGCWCD